MVLPRKAEGAHRPNAGKLPAHTRISAMSVFEAYRRALGSQLQPAMLLLAVGPALTALSFISRVRRRDLGGRRWWKVRVTNHGSQGLRPCSCGLAGNLTLPICQSIKWPKSGSGSHSSAGASFLAISFGTELRYRKPYFRGRYSTMSGKIMHSTRPTICTITNGTMPL